MRRRIPDWAWLPVGIAVGLAAARLILAPRILEREPPPGATVPATTEIRITFDQAMAEESVTERLHVDSPQAGEFRWQGTSLIYRPQEAWTSGSTVNIRLDPGAHSRHGPGMPTGARWSFRVSEPRLVYLWPAGGPAQIYTRILTDAEAIRLSDAPEGVADFSMGARGTRLVYVTQVQEGPTELRELDLVHGRDRLLFACPAGEACTSAVLSPDGNRLAFVRATSPAEGTRPATRRVWMLTIGDETPDPVSPEGDIAAAPSWSPQGWLAFVDASRGAILVVDVAQGQPFAPLVALPSLLGERGCWSPDGALLIYPDVAPRGSGSTQDGVSLSGLETHLFGWNVSTGTLSDLTAAGGWQAEDASPAFAPGGEWVIFSRRLLSPGAWTSGRQLWRMRPDGSRAERLTDEAFINHGAPAVSMHGDALAYLRFNLEIPLEPAQIWSFDIRERTGELVVEAGYLPAWIP